MKVYFEDGRLINTVLLPEEPDFVVDAADGVNNNIDTLNRISRMHSNAIVYTNSLLAFNNRNVWNNELKAPEVYVRISGTTFERIDKLTQQELKESHNLAKMYVAGEFEGFIKAMQSF